LTSVQVAAIWVKETVEPVSSIVCAVTSAISLS
jgi:hypothetical protein